MLFNSHEYLLLFLPITLIVYFVLNRLRLTYAAKLLLVVGSLFFYSWWNPKYLPLILGSIFFNFSVGTALTRFGGAREASRRILLIVGIGGNVFLLGYYKYTDFLVSNLDRFFHAGFDLQHIVLPLGISFFTFTQIAYLVDAYKRTVREYDLLNYSLFVTFFPHLLAGPIIHHKEIMPQFKRLRNAMPNYRNLLIGLSLLFAGLIKKVMIADHFSTWATSGFDVLVAPNLLQSWATSLSYTFQIYFDFSGYTDMALGAALMFNIKLPPNFNSPYKALNIQDFWRRWHMTLTRFLRDYIYIPLGGNRVSEAYICLNLMITFLIGGLWHGAGWTFLFWGFLHGTAIVVHHLWKKIGKPLPTVVAWLITFNFVNVAWVFFRAKKWDDAVKILSGMVGLNGIALPDTVAGFFNVFGLKGIRFMPWKVIMEGSRDAYLYVAGALAFCLLLRNSGQVFERLKPDWKVLVLMAFGAYTILNMTKMTEFLYFNF